MASANDMTLLLDKIERWNGLRLLNKHLPSELKKGEAWAEIINTITLPTFSRYFPHKFSMVISEETCYKKRGPVAENDVDHGSSRDWTIWYYIKDDVLGPDTKLLGVQDIDWTDYTSDNIGLSGSISTGYYYPTGMFCPAQSLETMLGLQFGADMMSLYNRGIYIDFEYPARFCLKGLSNVSYDLERFKLILLVEHKSLVTISPTKMEIFEQLANADVCNWLWKELRYYDGIETAYLNLDLKLDELRTEAEKREQVLNELKESYVSASNDQAPLIWTV